MRISLLVAAASTGLVLLAGCGDDGSTAAGDGEGGDSASASPSEDTPSEDPSPTQDPSPSDTPTQAPSSSPAAELPACAQVWVAGQDLPPRYAGCQQDGAPVEADGRECAFGRSLIIYGDRFYAVPGAVVNRTDGPVRQDPTYQDALRSCSG